MFLLLLALPLDRVGRRRIVRVLRPVGGHSNRCASVPASTSLRLSVSLDAR
jgi:hypothetical protein